MNAGSNQPDRWQDMTYHPRFEAAGKRQAACLRHAATQLRTRVEEEPGKLSGDAGPAIHQPESAIDARSAAAELSEAHVRLARRFPDECFSLGCLGAGARPGKMAVGHLMAFVVLLATIVVRSIS